MLPPLMIDRKNKSVIFQNLGLIDFKKAWDYQTRLFEKVIEQKMANRQSKSQTPTSNYLLFCSHPNVYTLGKSGDANHLKINRDDRIKKAIDFYRINRGGDITYHGPGQMVVYPILDLENFFTDINRYLRSLEEAVILTLREYGVAGERISGLTGVWIDARRSNPRKICALGVKTSRWVTMHGLALNVNADISYYKHIIPCGIDNKAVTSLHLETGQEVNLSEVEGHLKKHIAAIFQMELKYE